MEINLQKTTLEEFIPLFQEFYGERHDSSYHRPANEWAEVAKWRKEAYLFKQGGQVVGGVLLPEGIVTGLFTIPPFDDYQKLLDIIIGHFDNKEYTFYEIPKVHQKHYQNYELITSEVMMYMKPIKQELHLAEGYHASPIKEEDVEEIGKMLYRAFSQSSVYKRLDPEQEFISSAKGYFSYVKKDSVIYNSTLKVTDENKMIVGALLSMIDTGFPFAYNLAVDPLHQGRGIGKYLLSAFVDGVKDEYDKVRLFVHTNNPARIMYESVGFRYGEPIQNYVFTKKEAE